jgi:hypothetical protein
MNLQERAVLQNFLDQLVQVHGVNKVAQADAMIKRAVDQQPDAAYLLVQRALLLGLALNQAKARISELERVQEESSRGFLEPGTSPSWSASAAPTSTATATSARLPIGAASPFSQPAGPPGAPAGSPVSSPGVTASGFLGQAAAMAAGVAGGAFLFEGAESLFGHHGSSVPSHEAAPTSPDGDVTINNYHESNDGGERIGGSNSDFESDDGDFV